MSTFPNPTSGVVSIESSSEIRSVSVTTPAGTLVEAYPIINQSTANVQLEQLPQGIYWMTITTDTGITTKAIYKD